MLSKKSPSGALFPYYYKNGELFGLHLGSYESDEDGVIAMILAEEAFLLRQNRSIGIWIDFCQTKLTGRVVSEFVQYLVHVRPCLLKLGLVGCSTLSRWRLNRQMKKESCLAGLPVRYYSDPEDAKTWLVTETE